MVNAKKILNKSIECYSVAYAGGNPEGQQRDLFKEVTKQLSTDDKGRNIKHFALAENFGDVEKFFNKSLNDIIENWLYVQLTVGESQDGQVRWHLPTVNYHPCRKIKSFYMGFGLGFGYLSQTISIILVKIPIKSLFSTKSLTMTIF